MITIVSGLPRSGTSLMMQMLAAGGMPILADEERKADTDNPRGYLEWDGVRHLPHNPFLIADAEGKAMKVFSQQLCYLPEDRDYRIIFMERRLSEVLRSQEKMLSRHCVIPTLISEQALQEHLAEVYRWYASRSRSAFCRIGYHRVLREPKAVAEDIAFFLNAPLNVDAMADQVNETLYRTRMNEGCVPDLVEERFRALIDRHVGFELFDPERASLLPKKTYVAIHGRYVLLGFNESTQADQFFESAVKATI